MRKIILKKIFKKTLTKTSSIIFFISFLISLIFVISDFVTPIPVKANTSLNPRIEIAPLEGTLGTEVFVRIFDYLPNKLVFVKFGSGSIMSAQTYTDNSGYAATSLKIDLSPAGRYLITADDGTNIKSLYFTLKPKANISQTTGQVGDLVIVDGHCFAAKKPVNIYFNDIKVSTSDTNELGSFTNARFSIPLVSNGKHTIKVIDSEGNAFNMNYNVNPRILVNPTTINVNDSININGSGFSASSNLIIFFDDKDIATVLTDTQGVFSANITVPPCSGAIHKLKIVDGNLPIFADITVLPSISLSETTGHIGMPVTIKGNAFIAGNTISATYDSIRLPGTTVEKNGTFVLVFNVPKSKAGAHSITISDGVTTKTLNFIVESTPPLVPNPIKPDDGENIIKDIRLQWEPVSDPSGVEYMVQVADDVRFTKPIISQSGIQQTYFDILDADKIILGSSSPYYWRVKAIDGASNSSNWSAISTFYKGYTVGTIINDMPGWTKLILIGLGVILFVFLLFLIWKTIQRVRNFKEDTEVDEEVSEEFSAFEYEEDWAEVEAPRTRR